MAFATQGFAVTLCIIALGFSLFISLHICSVWEVCAKPLQPWRTGLLLLFPQLKAPCWESVLHGLHKQKFWNKHWYNMSWGRFRKWNSSLVCNVCNVLMFIPPKISFLQESSEISCLQDAALCSPVVCVWVICGSMWPYNINNQTSGSWNLRHSCNSQTCKQQIR